MVERAGFPPGGHAGKALLHILETYPRDELFQITEDELFDIAIGILQLQDRQRLRLFVRRDPFDRFVSCLVYVPRERYNTALRERMQQILEQAVGGTESEFQALLSESVAGAVAVHVRTPQGVPDDLDLADLERRLVETARGWPDRLAGRAARGLRRGARQPAVRRLWPRLPGFLPGADRRARGGARHRTIDDLAGSGPTTRR